MNNFFNGLGSLSIFTSKMNKYNPYINYSWSQTLTVGGNQQIKDTGTAGLNLQQFFGQGVWFNGIDQKVNDTETQNIGNTGTLVMTLSVVSSATNRYILASNSTTQRCYIRVNSSHKLEVGLGNSFINTGITVSTSPTDLILYWNNGNAFIKYGNITYSWNYSGLVDTSNITLASSNIFTISYVSGIMKDLYMFNRPLTPTEIEKYNNQPNQFFMDSLEDSSCILAMPMCEKNNLVRNYKNNSDYPITNYLTTCRTNAQRLPYGLQTSGFKRDSNGLILSKSNFLEADGVGYGNTGWIADTTNDFSIECVFNRPLNTADNIFGIGIGLASDFRFRVDSTKFTFTFGSPTKTINSPLATGSHLVSVIYKADTKTYIIFIDGVLIDSQSGSEVTNSASVVGLLSNSRGTIVPSSTGTSARLFKVHQKVLTQEEVTKNFNKYQAQGLLTESGLPEPVIPDNALVDENGNYILDENNNFIIVE